MKSFSLALQKWHHSYYYFLIQILASVILNLFSILFYLSISSLFRAFLFFFNTFLVRLVKICFPCIYFWCGLGKSYGEKDLKCNFSVTIFLNIDYNTSQAFSTLLFVPVHDTSTALQLQMYILTLSCKNSSDSFICPAAIMEDMKSSGNLQPSTVDLPPIVNLSMAGRFACANQGMTWIGSGGTLNLTPCLQTRCWKMIPGLSNSITISVHLSTSANLMGQLIPALIFDSPLRTWVTSSILYMTLILLIQTAGCFFPQPLLQL